MQLHCAEEVSEMSDLSDQCFIHAVTWQENLRVTGSVVAFYPDGRTILPSRLELRPPDEARALGAMPREKTPVVGDEEECVLSLSPKGNCYFAYPRGMAVEEHHGFFHIIADDGECEVTVVPAWATESLWAKKEGKQLTIVITLTEE